jgi:hypothetical protein
VSNSNLSIVDYIHIHNHDQTDALKEALRRNPEYETYITNLVSADYFKGEVRNSALWNVLEDKAAQVFAETRQTESVATDTLFQDPHIYLSLVTRHDRHLLTL